MTTQHDRLAGYLKQHTPSVPPSFSATALAERVLAGEAAPAPLLRAARPGRHRRLTAYLSIAAVLLLAGGVLAAIGLRPDPPPAAAPSTTFTADVLAAGFRDATVLAADGQYLYVGVDDRVEQLDPKTGRTARAPLVLPGKVLGGLAAQGRLTLIIAEAGHVAAQRFVLPGLVPDSQVTTPLTELTAWTVGADESRLYLADGRSVAMIPFGNVANLHVAATFTMPAPVTALAVSSYPPRLFVQAEGARAIAVYDVQSRRMQAPLSSSSGEDLPVAATGYGVWTRGGGQVSVVPLTAQAGEVPRAVRRTGRSGPFVVGDAAYLRADGWICANTYGHPLAQESGAGAPGWPDLTAMTAGTENQLYGLGTDGRLLRLTAPAACTTAGGTR